MVIYNISAKISSSVIQYTGTATPVTQYVILHHYSHTQGSDYSTNKPVALYTPVALHKHDATEERKNIRDKSQIITTDNKIALFYKTIDF